MAKRVRAKAAELPSREQVILYSGEAVQYLIRKVSEKYKGCTNLELQAIGKNVAAYAHCGVNQTTMPSGKDGYGWFCKLEFEFRLDGARVDVFFPRSDPVTYEMQRPIEVYAAKTLPAAEVDALLENLANTFYEAMQKKGK
jgi:hypothetical protein